MSQTSAQQKGRDSAPSLHQKSQGNHSVSFHQVQPPCARSARPRLSEYMRNKVAGFGTLFIHAGRAAWDWKDDPRAALLSPEDQDPAARDWSICQLATPPVLLFNRDASQTHLEATARACLRDGAARVLFVGLGTLPLWEAKP